MTLCRPGESVLVPQVELALLDLAPVLPGFRLPISEILDWLSKHTCGVESFVGVSLSRWPPQGEDRL